MEEINNEIFEGTMNILIIMIHKIIKENKNKEKKIIIRMRKKKKKIIIRKKNMIMIKIIIRKN